MSSPGPAGRQSEAAEVAAGLERLLVLIRWLSPAGLSLTAGATLSTLERTGPCRLTELAAHEGVTQPAMTQLVGRLRAGGLVERTADPDDGRVVRVELTAAGRELIGRRRAIRTRRLSRLLELLSPADSRALAAALPAINALASARRDAVTDDDWMVHP